MIRNLFLILLFFNFGFTQERLAILRYETPDDEYLKVLALLENIQLQAISTDDTLLQGKQFFLYIQEYFEGQLVKEDSLVSQCNDQKFPIITNSDTVYYFLNICDRITFSKSIKSFKIIIAGKNQGDSIFVLFKYPNIMFKRKFKARPNYSLRPALVTPDNMLSIPFEKKFPIFLLAPPYQTSTGLKSYCVLNNQPIEAVYNVYHIKHFFVILLEIR